MTGHTWRRAKTNDSGVYADTLVVKTTGGTEYWLWICDRCGILVYHDSLPTPNRMIDEGCDSWLIRSVQES
jgi:hypothetical protein